MRSARVSTSTIVRWVRMRLLLPAGLAAAVGFAIAAPAFPTPTISAENALPEIVPAARTLTLGKRRDEVVDVYEKTKAAVVNIHSERTVHSPADDPFNRSSVRPQQVNGMGTGIVIDPRGYIITNFHVVDEVTLLRVRLHDGSGYTARVLVTDKDADLALIKIDPLRPLPIVTFGTSSDLMVGEPVIAIGNAYGYEHTVTQGRVSFKGRDVSLNKDVGYKGLIQTSAPINPGNSGGPLLNVLGELVGVNVAIRAGAQNIGFALPIDFVIGRSAEMVSRKRGGIKHGLHLKDEVARESTENPARRVVLVEAVDTGSVAAAAGFKPGDAIDRVENVAVFTTIDVERALLDRDPAAKVAIKVNRGGEKATLDLTLGAVARAVPLTPAETVWKRLGIKVAPVGADAVTKANPQLHGGLMIAEVAAGSSAAMAGMLKGDVLVGLHSWETLRVDDVAFVLNHKDFASFMPLKYYTTRDGKLKDGWFTGAQ
ncbi:MAG TPA: trypsin-like peptidase domain-containing protein [Gemmataceae bacterium]